MKKEVILINKETAKVLKFILDNASRIQALSFNGEIKIHPTVKCGLTAVHDWAIDRLCQRSFRRSDLHKALALLELLYTVYCPDFYQDWRKEFLTFPEC